MWVVASPPLTRGDAKLHDGCALSKVNVMFSPIHKNSQGKIKHIKYLSHKKNKERRVMRIMNVNNPEEAAKNVILPKMTTSINAGN